MDWDNFDVHLDLLESYVDDIKTDHSNVKSWRDDILNKNKSLTIDLEAEKKKNKVSKKAFSALDRYHTQLENSASDIMVLRDELQFMAMTSKSRNSIDSSLARVGRIMEAFGIKEKEDLSKVIKQVESIEERG